MSVHKKFQPNWSSRLAGYRAVTYIRMSCFIIKIYFNSSREDQNNSKIYSNNDNIICESFCLTRFLVFSFFNQIVACIVSNSGGSIFFIWFPFDLTFCKCHFSPGVVVGWEDVSGRKNLLQEQYGLVIIFNII